MRKDALPKLLQLSTTPTLNISTPFLSPRETPCDPSPHSVRTAHRNHPFEALYCPTTAPIIDWHNERPDSWMSFPTRRMVDVVLVRPASMRVRGSFQPRSTHGPNPASEPPSSNGYHQSSNVSSVDRAATVAWISPPDLPLLPEM